MVEEKSIRCKNPIRFLIVLHYPIGIQLSCTCGREGGECGKGGARYGGECGEGVGREWGGGREGGE